LAALRESLKEEMPDRILTSHAGSLPRPEALISLNELRATGGFIDEEAYRREPSTAVPDVVERQRETGIDLVNDGEASLRAAVRCPAPCGCLGQHLAPRT
jgi:methionine synthase II (cobalamin-independent)